MTKITDDVCDIAKRLLEVDDCYRTFYNDEKQRFEVHAAQIPTAESLCLSSDVLDSRIIDRARQTRCWNADALWDEVEENNREIEREAKKRVDHKSGELADMMDFANRTSHPVIFKRRTTHDC